MTDDDEVGLKKSQKTQDNKKRSHQNEHKSTGGVGKLNIMALDNGYNWELQTQK